MPRREPLNDLIIRALESRYHRAEQLNQQEKFAYDRAIQAVRGVNRNITNPATQLKNVKNITPRIFGVIISVCNGELPEQATPPTQRQLQRATNQGPLRWENPPAVGSGAWAIIITLYRFTSCSQPSKPPDLTKRQIHAYALSDLRQNLADSTGGFSSWNGVKTCERKCWVHRDALSRRIGGPNGGCWGGAQDRFRLTDEGKELAAVLSQQEYQSRQPGQPRLQQQQARAGVPAGAAAAAAAAGGGGVTGFSDLEDSGDEQPFEQLMRASPAAAAAAAAPAFVGRGRRLGGTAAAAAAGGGAGTGTRGSRQAGPTQADRGGLLMSWEDDWGADPATAMGAPSPGANTAAAAAAAAASAARRRSAAAAAGGGGGGGGGADVAPATGTARRQLLPRVKASERLLPLCAADKGCGLCEALRDFAAGSLPQMYLANLGKAKQQHVRQVAGWLAAPEGGGHTLSITDGPGKGLTVHRKAAAAAAPTPAATGGRAAANNTAAGATGSRTAPSEPLGQLSELLGQRLSAPRASTTHTASPAPAAAGRASYAAGRLREDLFGAAAAAAAAYGAGGGDDDGFGLDDWEALDEEELVGQAAAAAGGGGVQRGAGGVGGDAAAGDEWLLDAEDLQEQAALLEAAAAARRQSQQQQQQQQQQEDQRQQQEQQRQQQEQERRQQAQQQRDADIAARQQQEHGQQLGQREGGMQHDGMTPAMHAAAAAEARMWQQQQQQEHHQSQQRQQQQHPGCQPPQQGGGGPEAVLLLDEQDQDVLLADTQELPDWIATSLPEQQQQQQQDRTQMRPPPQLRQQQQPSPHRAAGAPPCIVLLESQDAFDSAVGGAAAAATSAAAGGGANRSSRKRRPVEGSCAEAAVLLLGTQNEDASCAMLLDHAADDLPSPRPAKRRCRQQQQHQQDAQDGSRHAQQQVAGRTANTQGQDGRADAADASGGARAGDEGLLSRSLPACIEILDSQMEPPLDKLPPDTHPSSSGSDPQPAAAAAGAAVAATPAAARASRAALQPPAQVGAGLSGNQAPAGAAGTAQQHNAGSQAAAVAARHRNAGNLAIQGPGFELKLVVDENERIENPDPNHIYSSLRREHQDALGTAALPQDVTVDVDRDNLPLGDYMWLVLPQDNHRQQQQQQTAAAAGRGRAAAAASGEAQGGDEEGNEEEEAAAAERLQSLVAGAVVERKTVRDLVGRSAKRDHLRQLQRMHYVADVVPHQLFIIENTTQLTRRYVPYGATPGAAPGSSTVINDEPSLFDFIIRAAVSEYGDVQRILLAPSTADSRDILLAITQLLLYEQWQQQQPQQQQQQRRRQQQAAGADGSGAASMNYRQFKTLCHEVSRRLPRTALDPLMGALPTGTPRAPDAMFHVTRGSGEHVGLVLYKHRTYQGLRIVWLEGCMLLRLLNGFYATVTAEEELASAATAATAGGCAAAAAAGGTGSARTGLPVLQAVSAATEVAVLLASFLQSFLDSSSYGGSLQQQQQQQAQPGSSPCCILLPENLAGPHGAVNYMNKVQQQASLNPGRQAATKQAAARQQEVLSLSAAAVNEWLWLWLVTFVLQQDWHLHLAQSSSSVRMFLEAAGSRCSWLAEQLAGDVLQQEESQSQQQQRTQRQRLQEAHQRRSQAADELAGLDSDQEQQQQRRSSRGRSFSLLGDDSAGDSTAAEQGAEDDADLVPLLQQRQRVRQQQQQQQQQAQQERERRPQARSSGSGFMAWLDEQHAFDCQKGTGLHEGPPSHAGAVAAAPAAAAAAAGGTTAQEMRCRQRSADVRGQNGQFGTSAGVTGAAHAAMAGATSVIPDSEDEDDVIVLE